nr:hypothetical protein [Iocasia fonsfrigidae]
MHLFIRLGKKNWEVYLPEDNWAHLWTGEEYQGGIVEIDAPLGCPPVFYRKNSDYVELFKELSKI